MRIDPAIAALQRDRAPQRQAQAAIVAACDAWRAVPAVEQVLAEFALYGDGAPLAECPAVHALFADAESAPRLVAALLAALCVTLEREPLSHPPFRHGYDRGSSTLLLARRGRAQLVLHGCEPGLRRFDAASFSDGERHEAVLAGRACARVARRPASLGLLALQPITLEPGVRLGLDLREESLQVLAIERRLVSLRLDRFAPNPEPSREYDLSSGVQLRQAAGDIRASRQETMLALLGRMRCARAAPVMAAIAREPGDPSLRWQALRECLALDTAAGLSALCALASTASDPLARPARALRAQLVDTHPELAAQPVLPCPV
jgi:hypothetical protein